MRLISQHSSVTQIFCGPLKPPSLALEPEHLTFGAQCQAATPLEAFMFAFLSLCYHSLPSWHSVLCLKEKAKTVALNPLPPAFLPLMLVPQAAPSSLLSQSIPTLASRDVQANFFSPLQSEHIWVPNVCLHQAIFGRVWNAAGSSQLWLLACFTSLYPPPPLKIHLILEGMVSGGHCSAVHSEENCSKHPLPIFCGVSGSPLIQVNNSENIFWYFYAGSSWF